MKIAVWVWLGALALAQPRATIIPNLDAANWIHDPKDSSDSVVLYEDPKTGAMDLLVRYPAGHKLMPHSHRTNERLILLEGKLSAQLGDASEVTMSPGGLFIAPAGQTHRIACISGNRCTFYIAWGGK